MSTHAAVQKRQHEESAPQNTEPGKSSQAAGVGLPLFMQANPTASAGVTLQRKSASGGAPGANDECEICNSGQPLQAKLTIGASDDPLEREADRVAEQVLAAPAPCAVSSAPPHIQRYTAPSTGENTTVPASVDRVLASSGRPLDRALQQDMGQRFGHDFSSVRVHADGEAAEQSARDVNAHAYTVGHDIVFGEGRFTPETHAGQRLLAHELTHVVQQSGAEGMGLGDSTHKRGLFPISPPISPSLQQSATAGAPTLQRKCQATNLGAPTPDCTPSQQSVIGWQLQFRAGCDDLVPGEDAKLGKLKAGNALKIHGYASRDGDAAFSSDLSCHRANRIADMVRTLRADCPVIGIFKHGEPQPKDPNPPEFWRNVTIEQVTPVQDAAEQWLDPESRLRAAWAFFRRARANPTQQNLTLLFGWRGEVKDWLTGIGRRLAPQGAKLTQRNLDDYRRTYANAEFLWLQCDQVLASHKYPGADEDTYVKWAIGPGKDQGDRFHAKGVPTGAKYHVDIFGEGRFKDAINIGDAERTSTTGIHDSRVPNLIYRHFSGKNVNTLPIADHAADLVTSENGPVGYPGLADEIARIIAPGGTIVLFSRVNQEGVHDKVIQAVGGKATKDKSDRTIKTTIVAPGP